MANAIIDGNGLGNKLEINSDNAALVSVTSDSTGMSITNAIDSTAFDLNAAAFNSVTSISNDYILDSIEFNFSTAESKTITVTSSDGTILYGGTVDTTSANLLRNNTNKNIVIQSGLGFNGGENITVDVTQFGSAGTMDCILKVRQGGSGLVGNPVLGAGTNVIGNVNPNKISTLNARSASTLAAAAVYQGAGEDVSSYGRVGVSISSDNATDGVLTMEVSRDNVNWGGPTRNWSDTRFAAPHMWNIVEKYFRIKYVNGSTEAQNLAIQVQYSNNADTLLGKQLDETLLDETEAIIVRSVAVGQDPVGDYKNNLNDGLGFSTSALLANGATYDSTVLSLVGYTQVQTDILSDVDGTIVIDFIRDSGGTDVLRTLTIPYLSANGYEFFSAPAFTPYVRYRFTADEAGQADFYFDTKFMTKALSGQLLKLDAFVSSSMVAPITRSILTGVDPDAVYRNVKVTRAGDIQSSIADADLGFNAIVTPGGSLKIAEQTHLAGEAFGSVALNTTKWNIDLVGTGTQSAAGNGELTLDTGVTANSAVEIDSTDVARFIPANYNQSHHAVEIPDGASYAANNSRKWGAFNATSATCNGIYFEIDGGTWYVVHCIAGSATRVAKASWNGVGILDFPDNAVNTNVYEIEYNAGSIIFRVNGSVMHRVNLTATPYANNIHFPVGMSNTNSGGSTTDVSMKLRAAAIYTLGKGTGVDRPKYISGTTAGLLVKTGPGHLGKVVVARNGAGGGDATVSLYDALSAVTQIGRIALDQDITTVVDFDMTFNVGLYIVITGAGTLGTTVTFD